MEGWISIHRKLTGHFLYPTNRPFTEYEAWLHILLLVNHKDKTVFLDGKTATCQRGQSYMSLDNWAGQFNWGKGKVRGFFTMLKNEQIITTKGTKRTTILTVLNYDKYQISQPSENILKTTSEISEDKLRTTNNNVNNIYTTIGSEKSISEPYVKINEKSEENTVKNQKEEKKKSAAKKEKTLISSLTSPIEPKSKENLHLRLAKSIWDLLKPHHGKLLGFQSAILETWGDNVKKILKRGVEPMDLHDLVVWTLVNQPNSIPYFQSPHHLVKEEFKNFDRLTSLKANPKKSQSFEDRSKPVYTKSKYKVIKPDNK